MRKLFALGIIAGALAVAAPAEAHGFFSLSLPGISINLGAPVCVARAPVCAPPTVVVAPPVVVRPRPVVVVPRIAVPPPPVVVYRPRHHVVVRPVYPY